MDNITILLCRVVNAPSQGKTIACSLSRHLHGSLQECMLSVLDINMLHHQRQILDFILIATKSFDNRIRSGESGVLCKLGFSVVNAKERFWGEMVYLDSSLYFFSAFFSIIE
jgi:hypothetical protein